MEKRRGEGGVGDGVERDLLICIARGIWRRKSCMYDLMLQCVMKSEIPTRAASCIESFCISDGNIQYYPLVLTIYLIS